jgi:hypothetical protein
VTVAELIRELQAMPNQNARVDVVLSHAYGNADGVMVYTHLNDEDALEADDVRNMGAFVLIRSK